MIVNNDMIEATRLIRSGRLSESSALLRNLLGASPPSLAPNSIGSTGGAEPTIDLVPQGRGGAGSTLPPQDEATTKRARRFGADGLGGEKVGPLSFLPRGLNGLGELNGLSELAARHLGNSAPNALLAGARFDEHVYADRGGQRSYKLYVPSAAPEGPPALIVMLHGCTQSPDDFAAGTQMNMLAEEHGFLVAYPAQPQSANLQKCWNWFNASDQEREGGEPALLAGITRQIMRDHHVDPHRVYIAGLSAGAAAAAIMGTRYPDLYAAVGIHSGLKCGAARDMPSAFAAMRSGAATTGASNGASGVRAIVFHGDRDATVNPVNGEQVVAQFGGGAPLQREITHGQVPGGLAFTRIVQAGADGRPIIEHWQVHGAAHAWSGGSSSGSYTEPRGPDASREMVRFFLGGE